MSEKSASSIRNEVDDKVINKNYTTGADVGDILKNIADSKYNKVDLNRELVSSENSVRRITVDPNGGAEYESVQNALDENLAYIELGHVIIYLENGTYNEDVIVDTTIGNTWSDESILDTIFGIRFIGDTSAPSNVNGLSFGFRGVQLASDIAGVRIDRESPLANEGAGVISYKSRHTALRNCEIRNVNTGVFSYSSYLEIGGIDFGVDSVENAVEVKHQGIVYNEIANEGNDNLSGRTTGVTYEIDNGKLVIHPAASLSRKGNNQIYDIRNGEVLERGRGLITDGTHVFSIRASQSQTIQNQTREVVQFDDIKNDLLGEWDNLNNYWRPTEVNFNRYEIQARVDINSDMDEIQLNIQDENQKIIAQSIRKNTKSGETIYVSAVRNATVKGGQNFSLAIYGSSSDGSNFDINQNSIRNEFTINKI